jgi:acetyl esterase
VPITIYTPLGEASKPLVVFAHGGGFISGSCEIADGAVRLLAAASGAVVVSVDYRLAPEYPFPAGLEDAYAALTWAVESAGSLGADAGFTAVAGDSSGGNFAAALTLIARARGGPALAHQLLIYPVLDCDFSRPSYVDSAEGYFLTSDAMRRFWCDYVACDEDRLDPFASPLRATELAGLPSATMLLCLKDPLRSEGKAYAARLAEAGVPVRLPFTTTWCTPHFAWPGSTPGSRVRGGCRRSGATGVFGGPRGLSWPGLSQPRGGFALSWSVESSTTVRLLPLSRLISRTSAPSL